MHRISALLLLIGVILSACMAGGTPSDKPYADCVVADEGADQCRTADVCLANGPDSFEPGRVCASGCDVDEDCADPNVDAHPQCVPVGADEANMCVLNCFVAGDEPCPSGMACGSVDGVPLRSVCFWAAED